MENPKISIRLYDSKTIRVKIYKNGYCILKLPKIYDQSKLDTYIDWVNKEYYHCIKSPYFSSKNHEFKYNKKWSS